MKKVSCCFFIMNLLLWEIAGASALSHFLRRCAIGAGTGAVLGVVSLALTDRPGEAVGNIAKGASLGLYAGIAYGFYELNQAPVVEEIHGFSIMPKMINNEAITQVTWSYSF